MQYSIHKRRRLRIGKREKGQPAVVERTLVGAKRHREEQAPAVARPAPELMIAPVPAEPPTNESAHVVERRELVRIIHQSASFPVGLQRTITESRPLDHAEPVITPGSRSA